MDSSNISFTPTPVCDDVEVIANKAILVPWPPADSQVLAFYYDACLMCVGAAATLSSILWLIRRYGPYIFTYAKSPAHRTKENDRLLTRIHDKWYDLTKFEHPGGPIALSLIHQRDGTALFESHHPFMKRGKLLQILSKYEISGDDEKQCMGCALMDPRDDGYYAWDGIDNDKFVSDLRGLVHDYFSTIAETRGMPLNQAAKATPARWMLVLSLMTSFFGTLPWYIGGSWLMLFVTPILAWVTIANYWHDALHFALSNNWRINATLPYLLPLLSSPWMWYHHHVIGHHVYTNIGHKDPDLAHAPQLMREHESIRWRPTHLNQARLHRILLLWSIATGLGLNLLNDIRATVKSSYNNVVGISSEGGISVGLLAHIGGRIIYVYATFLWPFTVFPLWKASIWATVPNAIFSLCFMVNTQINHLCGPCAQASSPNFYKHQVITAQNFGNGSTFCYYFSGGLNYQIEHHLFPTVNHCHLPALSSGVKRICEKHGVLYNSVSGYREAIAEHFTHTKSMASKQQ